VPLSPQARKILHRLRPHTGGSEWVLESPYKAGSHLTTVKTASHGIVKRAGMRPWTPHDLRRTAVSKMRALGVGRRVVQAILNHKDSEITAVYDRYSLDPEKEQALSVWGRRVEEIVRPGGQGAVASFPLRSVLPGSSVSDETRGRTAEDGPHEDA
jgi:integrase